MQIKAVRLQMRLHYRAHIFRTLALLGHQRHTSLLAVAHLPAHRELITMRRQILRQRRDALAHRRRELRREHHLILQIIVEQRALISHRIATKTDELRNRLHIRKRAPRTQHHLRFRVLRQRRERLQRRHIKRRILAARQTAINIQKQKITFHRQNLHRKSAIL